MTNLYDAMGIPDDSFTPPEEETSEARRDRAFAAFCHLPRKSAWGWSTRLGAIVDIPPVTLRRWRKEYDWDLTFATSMSRINHDLERTAQAVLMSAVGKVSDRLIDVIEYGTDRDATSAIKVWSEMTGVTVRKPQQAVQINNLISVDGGEVRAYKEMSVEALFSQAKDHGQEQLDQSLMVRSGKGKVV